jgi:hypothetical protein
MSICERCGRSGGIERPVNRVLSIFDVVDELPDGELQTSNADAFTAGLCLSCASALQRLVQEFIERGPGA